MNSFNFRRSVVWSIKYRTKDSSGTQNATVRHEFIVADTPEDVLEFIREFVAPKILILGKLAPADFEVNIIEPTT